MNILLTSFLAMLHILTAVVSLQISDSTPGDTQNHPYAICEEASPEQRPREVRQSQGGEHRSEVILLATIQQIGAQPLFVDQQDDRSIAGLHFVERIDYERLRNRLPLLRNIRLLDLNSLDLTDNDLEQLRILNAFPKVESLNLANNPRIGNAGLTHLSHFRQLSTLNLSLTATDSNGAVHLKTLPRLRRIDLSATPFRRSGYSGLEQCTSLRELIALCNSITDEDLRQIAEIRQLRVLECLASPEVSDAGLQQVAQLVHLEILTVLGTKPLVTDLGVGYLASLSNLRELQLPGTKVTDDAIPSILRLTKLERLDLSGSCIDDNGVASLTSLRHLKFLDMQHTNVTPMARKHLEDCKELGDLRL